MPVFMKSANRGLVQTFFCWKVLKSGCLLRFPKNQGGSRRISKGNVGEGRSNVQRIKKGLKVGCLLRFPKNQGGSRRISEGNVGEGRSNAQRIKKGLKVGGCLKI